MVLLVGRDRQQGGCREPEGVCFDRCLGELLLCGLTHPIGLEEKLIPLLDGLAGNFF